MKHTPRVVAEHPSGAARHEGNATFLPCAPNVPPPSPTTQMPEHGGRRGLGGTPSLVRPRERSPLFGGVYVLVPIWLGAPRPAWRPDPLVERGPAGFLGRYLVTVGRRRFLDAGRTGRGEETRVATLPKISGRVLTLSGCARKTERARWATARGARDQRWIRTRYLKYLGTKCSSSSLALDRLARRASRCAC